MYVIRMYRVPALRSLRRSRPFSSPACWTSNVDSLTIIGSTSTSTYSKYIHTYASRVPRPASKFNQWKECPQAQLPRAPSTLTRNV